MKNVIKGDCKGRDMRKSLLSIKVGAVVAATLLAASNANAATPTMEEMWELIQKQQAEISSLKEQLQVTDQKVQQTELKIEEQEKKTQKHRNISVISGNVQLKRSGKSNFIKSSLGGKRSESISEVTSDIGEQMKKIEKEENAGFVCLEGADDSVVDGLEDVAPTASTQVDVKYEPTNSGQVDLEEGFAGTTEPPSLSIEGIRERVIQVLQFSRQLG